MHWRNPLHGSRASTVSSGMPGPSANSASDCADNPRQAALRALPPRPCAPLERRELAAEIFPAAPPPAARRHDPARHVVQIVASRIRGPVETIVDDAIHR